METLAAIATVRKVVKFLAPLVAFCMFAIFLSVSAAVGGGQSAAAIIVEECQAAADSGSEGSSVVVGAAAVQLTAVQVKNARVIIALGDKGVVVGGKTVAVGTAGEVVAIVTALQESRLRNLANDGTDPHLTDLEAAITRKSLTFANDGVGHNLDSVNVFQQRWIAGWGTVPQLMQPVYAATKFYSALVAIPGWAALPPGTAAQLVQKSEFGGAYAQWVPEAQAIVAELAGSGGLPVGGECPTQPAPPGAVPPGAAAFVAAEIAEARRWLGFPYVWGGGGDDGPTSGGFDCSGLIMDVEWVASGHKVQLDHDSDHQGHDHDGGGKSFGSVVTVGLGSTINMALVEPGDYIAFDNGDNGVGVNDGHYDHIGLYIGAAVVDGAMAQHVLLHASHPGAGGGVKLESLDDGYFGGFDWSVVRPAPQGPALAPIADPTGATMPAAPVGFRQVFADDFTGTSLDGSKWGAPYQGRPGGTRDSWWLPSHVRVGSGVAEISESQDDGAPNGEWTGGGFSSASHFSMTYGLVEVKMKAQAGRGVNALALMWPEAGAWTDEIDFAEDGSGRRQTNVFSSHGFPGNHVTQVRTTVDMTQWHVYGFLWSPGKLVVYVDGVEQGVIARSDVSAEAMAIDLQVEDPCGQGVCAVRGVTPKTVAVDFDWVVADQEAG